MLLQYPTMMTPITMDELADRFQNLQIREKPNSCNLPVEIIEVVIQNTDIVSRGTLRKVSKTLRELVDRQEPFCDLRVLKINTKYVVMNY
ncbi:hypothetical protein CAEBREN_23494 [Caenorhabditis brenneri]|uniref:F-box domain-containing protein n=1 Tax=Caenorhabditis brenneri TaxID=135651 RepID=G0P397_CAEBE|nr:hypothetical protein CAEBREN_23494 [Caenorhabditis brenneri]